MASWKKVIVSGSQAELLNITASAGLFNTSLNVGTNQQITTNPATTFLSGSFSGSFQGDVNINLADLTAGNGIVAFSYDGNSAQTVTLDTSSAYFTAGVRGKLSAAAYLGYDSATGGFTFDSGSYGTFAAGAGLTSTNGIFAVGAGTGITVNADDVQLKNAGSLTNNVLTKWDSSNGQLVNSGLTDDGTNLGIARNTSVTGFLSATGAITGSAISASGAIIGNTVDSLTTIVAGTSIQAGTNITAPSGYIKAGSPAGAPDTVGAVQGSTGYFTNLVIPGSASISGNVSITGDLSVAGTASFNNSTSLLVADKFILLASGSTSLTDGGFIIQSATGGIGTAFYLEAGSTGAYGRFAITGSLSAGASTATVDEFMVSVKQAAGVPSVAPTFGDTGNGYGNMYINSSNSDIYIYA
jgi:hypothetical protein